MKHIYLKSYLRHIGVLAPIVLFFAWLWNVPQFLIVVTLVVVLMVVAEFKIEEMLYRYHPDVRFTMLGLVRVVGIILWCAMIALIVYYRPEAFGYLLAYAICMPCLAGIAELIKIMGETFVSQLGSYDQMNMRTVLVRFFDTKKRAESPLLIMRK